MAEQVAKEVIQDVIKGNKPVLTAIAQKHGYSRSSALAQKPQKTDIYKRTMQNYINRLEKHRNKVLKAMEDKDLDQEDYRILSESLDRLSKQSLLLQGKSTENVAVSINVIDYTNTEV